MGNAPNDLLHMTGGGGRWTFFWHFSSLALPVWQWRCISTKDEYLNRVISNKGFCRTAPTTLGLLNIVSTRGLGAICVGILLSCRQQTCVDFTKSLAHHQADPFRSLPSSEYPPPLLAETSLHSVECHSQKYVHWSFFFGSHSKSSFGRVRSPQ